MSITAGALAVTPRLDPAHRDGLALVLSSTLTAAVGIVYWVVAARLFAPAVLGLNSVAVSTMMLLGSVAQLNIGYALLRFVPVAGATARRLVVCGYAVGTAVGALVGSAFALGAALWAPALAEAVGTGALVAFFAVATPVWALFVMQDFVLTALRRATTVPVANLAFALLKIVLLAVAVSAAVPGGIAVSWAVATLLLVLAVNGWLLACALPAHGRATAERAVPITVGTVGRFVRADYAGAVFWQAALFGLPLLVLARLGPDAAATYGIAWVVAQSLYLVSSGMGQSMVAHGAGGTGDVDAARRAMIRRAGALVLPATAVVVLGAPLILAVFGPHYVAQGAGLLVLAALSAVPNVVTASTLSAARLRGQAWVQVGLPASAAGLVLGLSWLLMPQMGVVAVGLAWLAGQLLVAAAILVAGAHWLPPPLGRHVEALRSAALLRRARPFAPALGGRGPVQRLPGRSGSVVVVVGAPEGPGALLKLTESFSGRWQLHRQGEVLAALRGDSRLTAWSRLLPEVLEVGEIVRGYATMESRMPGEPGTRLLPDPVARRAFVAGSLSTIGELHRITSTPVRVSGAERDRWVHEPMAVVRAALPRRSRAAAVRLENRLAARIDGRRLPCGWTHGDFTPDNVLTDADGAVVAVVDWGQASPLGMPALDVVSFQLTAEMLHDGAELGSLVLTRLCGGSPADRQVTARMHRDLGGDGLPDPTLVLLGWLAHVTQNLAKSPRFGANPVWMRRNVVAVVRGADRLLGS